MKNPLVKNTLIVLGLFALFTVAVFRFNLFGSKKLLTGQA